MGEFLLPVYHRTQFLRWSNTFSTERSHYTVYYMLCFVHKLFWKAKFLMIEANICHDLMTILFQTSLGNHSNLVKSTCRVYYTYDILHKQEEEHIHDKKKLCINIYKCILFNFILYSRLMNKFKRNK